MSLTKILGKIEVAPHHESDKTIGGQFDDPHSKVGDILFGIVCIGLIIFIACILI